MNMYVVFWISKPENRYSFLKIIAAESVEQAKDQFDACKVEIDDIPVTSDHENLAFFKLMNGGFNTWHLPAIEDEHEEYKEKEDIDE